jgi:hypothetical protein
MRATCSDCLILILITFREEYYVSTGNKYIYLQFLLIRP